MSAVIFSFFIFLQLFANINAFVLAGFPTTHILQSGWAKSSKYLAYYLNIFALACNKSFLSIPYDLGFAPTNNAIWQFEKASFSSVVAIIFDNKGEAVSMSSISTPFKESIIDGISKRTNSIYWFEPNNLPWAIMNTNAYPILPAAPVTTTQIGFFG